VGAPAGTWLILCLVFFLCTPASATAESGQAEAEAGGEAPRQERITISLGLNHSALAAAYPELAVWLETDDHGRILTLFKPESVEKPKGAVLILGDEGQGADTGLVGALRDPLVRAGWAVMGMGLSELSLPLAQARRRMEEQARAGTGDGPAPARAEAPAAAGNQGPESEAVMIDVMTDDNFESRSDARDAEVQAHLAAALADLSGRGYQQLVLVGVGRGAAHVARRAIADGGAGVSLVWIAPQFGPADLDNLAEDFRAGGPIPLLELTSSRDARQPAKKRQALMKRQGVASYTQQPVAMSDPPEARNAGQLAGRITAWLSN
jgi:hypothetical protein